MGREQGAAFSFQRAGGGGAILEVRDIHKRFEEGAGVLNGVSFEVEEGQIACLLGPSGCGKTTLLRIVAGLELPDQGSVTFEGQDMRSIPAHKRGFGLMFQDFALFPHKDVAGNVAFGLRMQGLPRQEIRKRVGEMLELVGLGPLAHRDVHQLSGGEQQRVALARALAPGPRLLMLDEPIGSLDRTLRDRLLEELRRILKQVRVTVLYVTHDQGEAFAIADRVIFIRQGRVVQIDTPEAVYSRPADAWVARFLGMQNLLPGTWVAPGVVRTEVGAVPVEGGGEGEVTLLIRPEAAAVGEAREGTVLHGTLTGRSFRGTLVHVVVQHPSGVALAFDLPASAEVPAVGQPIALTLRPEGIVCLEK